MMTNPFVESSREVLAAIVAAGPASELGEPERAVMRSVVMAPLAYSLLAKPDNRRVRESLDRSLKLLRINPVEAAGWMGGLVGAGHNPMTIERLVASSWLVLWQPRSDVTFVTLTALASVKINVILVEFGADDVAETRWGIDDPTPRRVRIPRHWAAQARDRWLETIEDRTTLGPLEAAILGEEAAREREREPVMDEYSGQQVSILGLPLFKESRQRKPSKKARVKAEAKAKARDRAKARKAAKRLAKLQRKVTVDPTPKPKPKPKPAPEPKPRPRSFDLAALRSGLETARAAPDPMKVQSI